MVLCLHFERNVSPANEKHLGRASISLKPTPKQAGRAGSTCEKQKAGMVARWNRRTLLLFTHTPAFYHGIWGRLPSLTSLPPPFSTLPFCCFLLSIIYIYVFISFSLGGASWTERTVLEGGGHCIVCLPLSMWPSPSFLLPFLPACNPGNDHACREDTCSELALFPLCTCLCLPGLPGHTREAFGIQILLLFFSLLESLFTEHVFASLSLPSL